MEEDETFYFKHTHRGTNVMEAFIKLVFLIRVSTNGKLTRRNRDLLNRFEIKTSNIQP
jgi:hypothetical protein